MRAEEFEVEVEALQARLDKIVKRANRIQTEKIEELWAKLDADQQRRVQMRFKAKERRDSMLVH